MAFYLGIDIGTSAVKVILLDEAQREHALAVRVLSVQRPAPGFSEQSADDWWQAVDSAVSEIAAKCPIEITAVRAIGLSGQMHGLVPLDSQNTPLRPAILWNDTRASVEAAELAEAHP